MRKILLLLSCLLSFNSYGLSFDCSVAKSKFEIYLCETNELTKLDGKLNATYKEAMSASENKKELISEQLLWLKERDECMSSPIISVESCLLMSYNKRIIQLSSITKTLKEISGEYLNMSIYCPSPTKDHGFPCDGSWGTISINEENLTMETVGGNYHSCSFSAKIEKQGAYFKAEKVSEINGKACTVKIYSDAEQITTFVEDGSHEACSEFCGARTSLNNLYANRKNK